MKATRLFARLYDAYQADEDELLDQVQKDLIKTKKEGKVETEELTYSKEDDGTIKITDKGTGEVTKADIGEHNFLTFDDLNRLTIPTKSPDTSSPYKRLIGSQVVFELDKKLTSGTILGYNGDKIRLRVPLLSDSEIEVNSSTLNLPTPPKDEEPVKVTREYDCYKSFSKKVYQIIKVSDTGKIIEVLKECDSKQEADDYIKSDMSLRNLLANGSLDIQIKK